VHDIKTCVRARVCSMVYAEFSRQILLYRNVADDFF